MKVFISWSGERSRLVAEALRYWLPKVIQAVQPWMSSSDIEKGTRWRSDIASELEQSSIGIICLTPENLNSSWIHFEAGALSKQQQNTYVCTFLYNLEPADVREPLAQFQNTKAQRDDVMRLIQTINNALADRKLSDSEVNESFEIWWNKLDQRLNAIPTNQASPEPQRPEREILEEILGIVRSQARTGSVSLPDYTSHNEVMGVDSLSIADGYLLASYMKMPIDKVRTMHFLSDDLAYLLAKARWEAKNSSLNKKAKLAHKTSSETPSSEEEDNENSNS